MAVGLQEASKSNIQKKPELKIKFEAKLLTETIIQHDYAFLDNCFIIQFFPVIVSRSFVTVVAIKKKTKYAHYYI